MTPQLSIITVLFGGAETLADTLPTWRDAFGSPEVEIVVVDNSPSDDVETLVRATLGDSNLVYVKRPDNPGFAAGANLGAAMARSEKLIFLNADIYVDSGTPQALLRIPPEVKVGAIRLRTNGVVYEGIKLSWYGYLEDRKAGDPARMFGPSGGGAFYQRSIFEELGGFSESMFAWGEDSALALQASAAGHATRLLDLTLEHIGGHTVASIAGRRFKARLLARNRVWTFRSHFATSYKWLVAVPFFGALTANGLLRKSRDGSLVPYFQGVMDGLLVTPPHVDPSRAFSPWSRPSESSAHPHKYSASTSEDF